VALVDDTPQCLLGAYFGAPRFSAGLRTLGRTESQARADIHVASRPRSAEDSWVDQVFEQLEGEFDRMIVDVSPSFPNSFLTKVFRSSVALVPLLPDLRTACRIDPILKRLRALNEECGAQMPTYLLLSQFDSNIRLHCEFAKWVKDEFGPMLLPVALRRANEVSEALADGQTVIDYAPNSGIAHDFRTLAAWIRQLPGSGERD